MAATKMSLKLLVDKRNQTVLFAEAGKDFVDFLFNCLALPVGTIMSLLPKAGVAGSLPNLYASAENLSDMYIERREKEALLNPKTRSSGPDVLRSLLLEALSSAPIDYYSCPGTASAGGCTASAGGFGSPLFGATDHPSGSLFGNASHSGFSRASCGTHVTDSPYTRCPGCNNTMSKELSWVTGPAAGAASSAKVPSGEGGSVRGLIMYMVMDDLVVKLMSTISSITLLNRFHLRDIGDLEEKVVDFGLEEGYIHKHISESLYALTPVAHINSSTYITGRL